MTFLGKFGDALANIMTGSGTTVDRRTHARWVDSIVDRYQIDAAYRGNWLMRKIVDLPPKDMTREWRDWQANDDQIEKLEAEETRLKVRLKVRAALVLARLGGGAIILGVDQGGPADELNVDALRADSLKYMHVVSRWQVELGEIITDPESEWYGEPEYFELTGKGSMQKVRVHPSRVITFRGLFSGTLSTTGKEAYWGDSLVMSINEAVVNATTAMNEFASLISEAKVDVLGIPEMMNGMGNPDYEKKLMRRLELAQVGKSVHRALVKDAAETWEQKQINWAGMPDVMRAYLAVAAGAADIPATRLLGKAPDGMNATGEGDDRNYNAMIASMQENDLSPLLERLDAVLIPSALGSRPDEVHYVWAPLSEMTEAEQAEIEEREAKSVQAYALTGLIDDEALGEAVENRLIESGRWPGLEDALKKAKARAAREPEEPPEPTMPQPGNPAISGVPRAVPPPPPPRAAA